MSKLHLTLGNDNGNCEHDLVINGDLIQAPNVNFKLSRLPWGYDEKGNLQSALATLKDNILVNIVSDSVKNNGLYMIGTNALKEENVNNLLVGIEQKSDSDLPVINTLGQLAVYAVQKDNGQSKNIDVTVDMCTALPVKQYTDERSKQFRNKFMEKKHIVTVYMAGHRVDVNIEFEYVKVLPEAVPVIFGLDDYQDKTVLHVDIGAGTTDLPITDGVQFKKEFVYGTNNGVGHAIEKAVETFKEETNLFDCSIQFYSDCLINKNKYSSRAYKALELPLDVQIKEIYKATIQQLNKVKNMVDVLLVYGGGSILMETSLRPMLEQLAKEREVELVYMKDATLNAKGLYAFTQTDIFQNLKNRAVKS